MKRLFSIIGLIALSFSVNAQTNTIPVPTNAPAIFGPIWTALDFLSHGSNWMVTPFGIYDTGTKSGGGGVAAILKTGDFLNPVLRLDYLDSRKTVYMPSGNLTFQYPITVGSLSFYPFGFAGAAIPIAGRAKDNGGLTLMYGIGLAVRAPWNASSWYVPKDLVFDWEHWGGFNGEQYRFGFNWKF